MTTSSSSTVRNPEFRRPRRYPPRNLKPPPLRSRLWRRRKGSNRFWEHHEDALAGMDANRLRLLDRLALRIQPPCLDNIEVFTASLQRRGTEQAIGAELFGRHVVYQ